MKRKLSFKGVCVAAILFSLAVQAEKLPVKEILGREYYTYTVKKGDSVYGIVHRYGWDETEFVRLNPSVSEGLRRGETVYYPTGKVAVADVEPSVAAVAVAKDLPELKHKVKRGETVYSISKLYGIPVQTIYDAVPSSKSGIKAGETLVIDQNKAGFGDPARIPFYYEHIKPGDTLYGTSKELGLTVEDLLAANPGLSETNFRAGELLKIPVNDKGPKVKREMVEVQQLASLSSYKVEKEDTWSSISLKTGVNACELKEANEGAKLKKDQVLAVPVTETIEVEREIPWTDAREETSSGRREIYDSIHHVAHADKISDVKIALVLDDPSSKRDSEFTRGFLLALKQLGDPGFKVEFKVVDASKGSESAEADVRGFNPQLVLSLSDKGTPDWMIDLGTATGAETLNVFDAKSDAFASTPTLIQLLTPSAYFYDLVSESLSERYSGRRILTVSKGGDTDLLISAIEAGFSDSAGSYVMIDNLNPSLIPGRGDLLVIADLADRKDVETLFAQLAAAREENPLINSTVVGKPSWVTFADALAEKFYENDVVIPSRFFFDHDSEKGNAFIADYTALFGRGPLKSYPNYAATGYDVANWFIPALALNDGDFNVEVPETDYLQIPVALKRKNNWGGFLNTRCLLVRFTPYRTIETEQL